MKDTEILQKIETAIQQSNLKIKKDQRQKIWQKSLKLEPNESILLSRDGKVMHKGEMYPKENPDEPSFTLEISKDAKGNFYFHQIQPGKDRDGLNGTFLGKGAFGRVKQAREIFTHKIEALKVSIPKDQKNIDSIINEFNILELREEGISYNQKDLVPGEKSHLYMSCFEEKDLFEQMHGKLSEWDFNDIGKLLIVLIKLLAEAKYTHSLGIIHRDIKLENIILGLYYAVFIDFNLAARLKPEEPHCIDNRALGTPAYISKDLYERHFRGLSIPYSKTTDAHALKIVAHFLQNYNCPVDISNAKKVSAVILKRNTPFLVPYFVSWYPYGLKTQIRTIVEKLGKDPNSIEDALTQLQLLMKIELEKAGCSFLVLKTKTLLSTLFKGDMTKKQSYLVEVMSNAFFQFFLENKKENSFHFKRFLMEYIFPEFNKEILPEKNKVLLFKFFDEIVKNENVFHANISEAIKELEKFRDFEGIDDFIKVINDEILNPNLSKLSQSILQKACLEVYNFLNALKSESGNFNKNVSDFTAHIRDIENQYPAIAKNMNGLATAAFSMVALSVGLNFMVNISFLTSADISLLGNLTAGTLYCMRWKEAETQRQEIRQKNPVINSLYKISGKKSSPGM